MWMGIGEWLQLQAPRTSGSEAETWLGWDGWVDIARGNHGTQSRGGYEDGR